MRSVHALCHVDLVCPDLVVVGVWTKLVDRIVLYRQFDVIYTDGHFIVDPTCSSITIDGNYVA